MFNEKVAVASFQGLKINLQQAFAINLLIPLIIREKEALEVSKFSNKRKLMVWLSISWKIFLSHCIDSMCIIYIGRIYLFIRIDYKKLSLGYPRYSELIRSDNSLEYD